MKDNRESFVFYRSFKEALEGLDDSDKLIMYEAIAGYALDRTPPQLAGFPKALFSLIKPQLDANWKRYEAGVTNGWKGGEHGKKGGRPKKEKPSNNPLLTQSKPSNVNVNVNVNDNVNDIPADSGVKEIYSFDDFWNDYDKKRGDKVKLSRKWGKIPDKDKLKIKEYIPRYKAAQPDKQFRKDPGTFLNNKGWEDEIIQKGGANEPVKTYKQF